MFNEFGGFEMRFILSLLMISALTFVLACQSASPSSTETKNESPLLKTSAEKAKTKTEVQATHEHEQENDAPRISLADAKKDFDENNAVFIDARSADNYKTEHIKGAINVPVGEFKKYYKSIPKDKKLIVYCS